MRIFFVFLIGLFVTACTANDVAIFRSFDIEGDERPSVLIDAKQRAIISTDRSIGDVSDPVRVFCAEPSPDALSAISSSFATSLSVGLTGQGEGSAALGAALTEAAAEIGKRNATIQILRDGFYRLCEASVNDSLRSVHYNLHANKLLSSMVALLAIEQLTPPSKTNVNISSSGGTKTDVETGVGSYGASDADNQDASDTQTSNETGASPTQEKAGASAGQAVVAVNLPSGSATAPSADVTKAVSLIIAEYMHQSRFADCILAMDNVNLDLMRSDAEIEKGLVEPRAPNTAQKALIDSCSITLSQGRSSIGDALASSIFNTNFPNIATTTLPPP